MWPQQAQELRTLREEGRRVDRALRLLKSSDADFRAAGCELLGLRGEAGMREVVATAANDDRSPLVQRVCREALGRFGASETAAP